MKLIASVTFALAFSAALVGQNQAMTTVNPISGYSNVTANPTLAPAHLTVESWVYFVPMNLAGAGVYPTIIRKNVLAAQEVYFMRVQQGTGRVAWKVRTTGGSATATSPAALPTNTWTHLAGTWDGTTCRLYINGVQVATAVSTGNLSDTGGDVRIGEGDAITGGGETWNGGLDEVRLWSTARTAAQILGTMNWQLDNQAGLVSAWHLNGDLLDGTGSNHGTQVGSLGFTPSGVTLNVGAPPFQQNSAIAQADFDGVAGDGFSPGIVQKTYTTCAPAATTVNFQSINAGLAWDLALTVGPSVSAVGGGFYTAGGQAVNINFADPSLAFLYGLTLTTPFYPASIPLTFGSNFDITMQMFVLSATSPDGLVLSAANELHVTPGATGVAGPTGDDSGVTVQLSNPAFCGAPASIPFYGVNYTQFDVISNGRVMFGAPALNTTFTPTAAAALSGYPFLGAWCDLNPAAGGTITVTVPAANVVRVNYNAVYYFGTTTPVTFAIEMNGTTGVVSVDLLGSIPVGTAQQFIGISRGVLGPATDPGSTTFVAGGPFSPANPTNMIYRLGTEGSLTPGLTRIDFVPVGSSYDWYAY